MGERHGASAIAYPFTYHERAGGFVLHTWRGEASVEAHPATGNWHIARIFMHGCKDNLMRPEARVLLPAHHRLHAEIAIDLHNRFGCLIDMAWAEHVHAARAEQMAVL